MDPENLNPNDPPVSGDDLPAGTEGQPEGGESGADAGAPSSTETGDGMAEAMAEGLKTLGVEPSNDEPAAQPGAADEPAGADGAEPKVTDAEPKEEEGQEGDPAPKEEASADDEIKDLGIKNERAQKRFTELRERDAKLREIEGTLPDLQDRAQQYEQMLGHITSTGATPEQYQAVLSYLHVWNKGTPEQLSQMRDVLMKEVQAIEGKIGISGDVLANHPDLAAAVESGDVTKEYAQEIARTRTLRAAQEQHTQRQAEDTQRQTAQQRQAMESAKQDLDDLGSRLQRQDPQYPQKVEAALASFRSRMDGIPPSRWAAEFMLDYSAVKVAAPEPAKKPPVSAVPLRPQGGGSMGKVASSMEEAMMMGLQAHGQGRA